MTAGRAGDPGLERAGGVTAGQRVLLIEVGGRGGVADYTQELATALAGRGVAVDLATAKDHRFRPAPGVRIHPVVGWVRGTSAAARAVRRARLGPLANALRFLAALPRIARLARRSGTAHMQGEYFPPLTALLAVTLRALGVTYVHTAHGTFDRGRSWGWAHRLITARAQAVIVHTQADLARLPPGPAARATVIPHGEYGGLARAGGTADRNAARTALSAHEDAVVALLFGQLRPDKGIGDLLAAAAEVPELHVVLAGEDLGGLSREQRALADPALAGRVTVREGFLEMQQVAELFAAADLAVLPYTQASQSGVLLLAYGFARPVVAYPVGGLGEAVVDGETGWLCARADPQALSEALRAAVAAGPQERSRRGASGERLAAERYAWPAIAEATQAVYRRAS